MFNGVQHTSWFFQTTIKIRFRFQSEHEKAGSQSVDLSILGDSLEEVAAVTSNGSFQRKLVTVIAGHSLSSLTTVSLLPTTTSGRFRVLLLPFPRIASFAGFTLGRRWLSQRRIGVEF